MSTAYNLREPRSYGAFASTPIPSPTPQQPKVAPRQTQVQEGNIQTRRQFQKNESLQGSIAGPTLKESQIL